MVAVAQLVESQLVELVVTGSSPVGHPKNMKKIVVTVPLTHVEQVREVIRGGSFGCV